MRTASRRALSLSPHTFQHSIVLSMAWTSTKPSPLYATLTVAFRDARPTERTAGNISSKATICCSDKLREMIACHAALDAGEIGGAGGGMPIFIWRRTSPLLEAGMCARGCAAILELRGGSGQRLGRGLCLGGLEMIGAGLLSRTSSLKRARRLAASDGDGIPSPSGSASSLPSGALAAGTRPPAG